MRASQNRGNSPRDHPARKFYAIEPCADGTVDVYLIPSAQTYHTDVGVDEYDIDLRVVRGVVPYQGLEDDIRCRYESWCDSAEVIDV